MKYIKLILKIVAFVVMLWFIKQMISTDDRSVESEDTTDNTVGIDKDVDAQVKSILSDDVIESSSDSGDDFSFSTGVVIDGSEYRSDNAVYEKVDDRVEISLPVSGMLLTIKLNRLSTGDYSLTESGNEMTLFDGENFTSVNDGVVTISAVSGAGISGWFKSDQLTGKFTDVLAASTTEMKGKEITHAHAIYFTKATSATEVKKISPSEFYYDSSLVTLKIKGDSDKNFSENIDKIETTPTAVTLYVSGDEIDFVTIDMLNSNQITVQYSNGDNMVLL